MPQHTTQDFWKRAESIAKAEADRVWEETHDLHAMITAWKKTFSEALPELAACNPHADDIVYCAFCNYLKPETPVIDIRREKK